MFRLGVPPVTGMSGLPYILNRIRENDSAFKIRVTEDGYVKLQKLVLNEVLDMTLCLEDGVRFPDLVYEPVLSEELCLCVGSDHPLAEREGVFLEEIKNMGLASLERDSYNYQKVREIYRKYHARPRVVFLSNRPQALIEYVKNDGNAGTFLPRGLLEKDNGVSAISLNPPYYMNIMLAYRKELLENPYFQSFRECIR